MSGSPMAESMKQMMPHDPNTASVVSVDRFQDGFATLLNVQVRPLTPSMFPSWFLLPMRLLTWINTFW